MFYHLIRAIQLQAAFQSRLGVATFEGTPSHQTSRRAHFLADWVSPW